MKLGLLTACLPELNLEQIATFAADTGLESLEIAAWPRTGDRPFTASHLDVTSMTEHEANTTLAMLDAKNLEISGIAYYDNNLHPDPNEREAVNSHVMACIDAAVLLGCSVVGTFVGRDPMKTVSENLREAEQLFPRLVDYGGERGVRLAIENCPMEGWHPDGYPGNLAYSPELWEWMFSLGLYLNFDPSHPSWLGMDPAEAVRPYVARVVHAQAKDLEVFPERRNHYGFFGKAVVREDPWDVGWWRYRIPGFGQVDWQRVIDALYEGGFDGTLAIEHEDPVWGGSESRIKDGVQIAARKLRSVLAPTT